MYVPNGMIMQNWAPIGEGAGFEFNTTMCRWRRFGTS